MFSQEIHCTYRNNQLGEVICQLRFPEILSIQTDIPSRFQEAIRREFPKYGVRKENLGNPQVPNNNHQFSTADDSWRVNLTSKFFAIATNRYTTWEDFAKMLDNPLAAFIQLYEPAYFERVGLRYLNFFSRNALGLEGVPFRDLLTPCYLGILDEEDLSETDVSRCSVDAEFSIRGGCRCKLHAGPGKVGRDGKITDLETKFILDMDLYMPGKIPVNLSAGALQTLHGQSWSIFRNAITQKLHDAMEPM